MKIKLNTKNKKNMIILASLAIIVVGSCVTYGIKSVYKHKQEAILQAQTLEKEAEEAAFIEANKYKPVRKFDDTTGKKIAYLTFDDGPSENSTPQILDILKKNNINATFFLIGNLAEKHPDMVKREAEEGNKIGIHTYSHDYKILYENPEALMDDINKEQTVIKGILGEDFETHLFRFPGGSAGRGTKFNEFKEAVTKDGYTYIDWNALNGDAEKSRPTKDYILERIKKTVYDQPKLVVLMHDSSAKKITADNLQEIIDFLKSKGYEFDTLTEGDTI